MRAENRGHVGLALIALIVLGCVLLTLRWIDSVADSRPISAVFDARAPLLWLWVGLLAGEVVVALLGLAALFRGHEKITSWKLAILTLLISVIFVLTAALPEFLRPHLSAMKPEIWSIAGALRKEARVSIYFDNGSSVPDNGDIERLSLRLRDLKQCKVARVAITGYASSPDFAKNRHPQKTDLRCRSGSFANQPNLELACARVVAVQALVDKNDVPVSQIQWASIELMRSSPGYFVDQVNRGRIREREILNRRVDVDMMTAGCDSTMTKLASQILH